MKSDTMKATKDKAKFTAGPWTIHNNIGKKGELGIVADKAPCIIAVMCNREAWPTEAHANARLISQAPEMIQALEEALQLPVMSEYERENWGNKCAGIIARAKGEKP